MLKVENLLYIYCGEICDTELTVGNTKHQNTMKFCYLSNACLYTPKFLLIYHNFIYVWKFIAVIITDFTNTQKNELIQ